MGKFIVARVYLSPRTHRLLGNCKIGRLQSFYRILDCGENVLALLHS